MTVPSPQDVTAGPAQKEPYIIRAAKSTDATSIAKLGAHVFTVSFAHSVAPHELDAFLEESYTPAAITKDLAADATDAAADDNNNNNNNNNTTRDIIVATDAQDDQIILGFAYLTRGSTDASVDHLESKCELQRIYVHPAVHGRGIGRLLATRVENMAREQGFKNIWLGVWEENANAIKAYEKWGYRRVGDHDFVIGTVVQTDYIMLKDL
ncbi:acyl-CoA N-acyltransferase [Xylona heveae TC161]|uniref:Acyl-CoA N-acyltransferase n=1 Tax=Xylona heveae (strain CBS 132557 / TC161) TaxID=1328760 RepID=A0A164ZW57_XYLHT|nr:acyl-CoA N-acyltransferase [Xylona heveae TC161]KZF19609.1 acyl-CoA N-acyltransferase [Xylona heveae TC161]